MSRSLLIGDIGGTNARFALMTSERGGFSDAQTLKCADFSSAEDAIDHYLRGRSADAPTMICLAVAGPVVADSVHMTNNHWTVNAAELADRLSVSQVRLINDFEALAYSIPRLGPDDCTAVGSPERGLPEGSDFRIAIVGPGTGLGCAGLIRQDGVLIPVVGEGGNMGFAPVSGIQIEILDALRGRFDRVTIEHLVSGGGVENIYWALTRIHGEQQRFGSAEEIFTAGKENSDARASEATSMFFELLGQVAGDLALALGAADGVYIAGGIVKRYPELLAGSRFRSAFDGKGSHRYFVENIPVFLVMHDQPGLLGVADYANQLSSS